MAKDLMLLSIFNQCLVKLLPVDLATTQCFVIIERLLRTSETPTSAKFIAIGKDEVKTVLSIQKTKINYITCSQVNQVTVLIRTKKKWTVRSLAIRWWTKIDAAYFAMFLKIKKHDYYFPAEGRFYLCFSEDWNMHPPNEQSVGTTMQFPCLSTG